jgi:hypothetical protein
LLPAGLLDLLGHADTDQTVVGLELLQGFGGVVDESKACGLATTIMCPETEDGDLFLVGFVQLGKLAAEFVLGDIGTAGMEDVTIQNKISPC